MEKPPSPVLKRVAAAISCVALLAACSGEDTSNAPNGKEATRGGPDRVPAAAVYAVSFSQGATFSDAYDRVLLTGRKDARLDHVEILGGDGYFELAGVRVAGPNRRIGSIQFDDRFPPQVPGLGQLAPGEGALLETGRVGSLLIVGLKVAGSGEGYRAGLRIYYSVDGKLYFQDHPSAVVNCPGKIESERCDSIYDQAFEEAQALVD